MSFLSLIGSPNSPRGVPPRRSHVSPPEVNGDTLNLKLTNCTEKDLRLEQLVSEVNELNVEI